MRAITLSLTYGEPAVKVGVAGDGGCLVTFSGTMFVGGSDMVTDPNVGLSKVFAVPDNFSLRLQRGEELWVAGVSATGPTTRNILVTEGDLS